MTASSTNRLHLVQGYIDAYNRCDVPAMLRTLHPDIEFKNVSGGRVTSNTIGIAQFEEKARASARLFKTRHQHIEEISFLEDRIEVRIGYSATLAVDLPNGLRAGRTIELNGRSIFRFSGDLIIGIEDIS
ncbi:MAG: nuclear transport factor 2 family protein [Acidobacteria bacterium]|nr:nuclear transport factor 2 family protein [Acidobacteriota bacterium]